MNAGKQFELEVQQLLRQMGLDADITGYSQDGGIDLIAINRSPVSGGRYVIQCKNLAAAVGEPAIRDLFGTVHSEGASKGILITTSYFTAAALRFAKGKPLELIDGSAYQSLCEQYGFIRGGPPPLPLADDVFLPGATTIRVISVESTGPEKHSEFRYLLYSVGTLFIGNKISYDAPDSGSFEFSDYRVERVTFEESLSGRLEITFVVEFIEPTTYHMEFEGRSEVIRPLYQAALAKMSRRATTTRSGVGCLVMLALPVGAAILVRILHYV